MSRFALVLGSHTFTDSRLDRLRSPAHDVGELSRVLADPEIGQFVVTSADNPTAQELRSGAEEFFGGRDRDDVLLLYYTGHGIREGDELLLAGSDTDLDDLAGTALSATVLKNLLGSCRARRIVLILDCCYSGAFAHRMVPMGEQRVHVQEFFGGRGLTLITASTAREYAFEAGEVAEADPRPSVFTGELIRGLDSGAADLDGDGEITLDELYQFLFDAVQLAQPGQQTPCRWVYGARGRMVIALRRPGPRPRVTASSAPDPVRLPAVRRQAIAMVPAAAAGAAALWGAWRYHLVSLGFTGGCLLVAALAGMAACLLGETVLEADGLRIHGWHNTLVPWSSILAIECRTTLFGTTVAAHRADTAVTRRVVLPAPKRLRPFRPVGFDDDVETLRQWTLRRGSPAPVHYGRTLLPLRNAIAVTLIALTLLTGIDHPWNRGNDIASVPRACRTLDKKTANSLVGGGTATLVNLAVIVPRDPPVETMSQQESRCNWTYAELFLSVGDVDLQYTRYQTDADTSGPRQASQVVRKDLAGEQRKHSRVTRPWQLANGGGFTAEASDRSAITVVAARDNIVVTLTFTSKQLSMPDQAQLLDIETRALHAVKPA
ncbi:caspase family protein [Streptomyces sp. NBC_01136]|uniref:caspase family protein n=1 Tax=Streptomyces sp. NBC_01136 TaxID=2903754 RepID=UPI00386B1CFD|nr:caspase family protein [Streptomyces sp. NBC_01136]